MNKLKSIVPVVIFASLQACGSSSDSTGSSVGQPESLPIANGTASLMTINDLSYAGAFALPTAEDEVSSLNYSVGVIEANGSSLFIVGHEHDEAIAEFTIPRLVQSNAISQLNVAEPPKQGFVKILDRAAAGNPESLNEITGLELIGDQLIVNAVEFYDGPGDNRLSTLVVDDASNLDRSKVSEFLAMEGRVRASGWISEIPESLAGALGGNYISGHSSGGPIISRHSVGPSAFVADLENIDTNNSLAPISTKELLGYSLSEPLNADLLNESGENKLWTHVSQAVYGFIVPGTDTYATIGWSGGHETGIGYKITQNDGRLCGGFCSYGADDNYNYYWLWDVNDLMDAASGAIAPNSIEPYEFGRLNVPFQTDERYNPIGGASYDAERGLLYMTVLGANNEIDVFSNPPIVVAYRINR